MAMEPSAANLAPRRYRVIHTTTYTYNKPVTSCYERGFLMPRDCPSQTVLTQSLYVNPSSAMTTDHVDLFGNHSHYVEVLTDHEVFEITKDAVIDVAWPTPTTAELNRWTVREAADLIAADERFAEERTLYWLPSRLVAHTDAVREYAAGLIDPDAGLGDALTALTVGIYSGFRYKHGVTSVRTTVDELLALGAGVCQDFAHLALASLRVSGLPARYVSGYIETAPPPGKPKLAGSDATHAWASVLLPDGRWIDLDPTNAHYADSRYVVNAWGRDFTDVSPLRGVIYTEATESTLKVGVDVIRLDEEPVPLLPA